MPCIWNLSRPVSQKECSRCYRCTYFARRRGSTDIYRSKLDIALDYCASNAEKRHNSSVSIITGNAGFEKGDEPGRPASRMRNIGDGPDQATFFDEYYPNPALFSCTAKRLVRRLVVLKVAGGMESKGRGTFFEKKMEYM